MDFPIAIYILKEKRKKKEQVQVTQHVLSLFNSKCGMALHALSGECFSVSTFQNVASFPPLNSSVLLPHPLQKVIPKRGREPACLFKRQWLVQKSGQLLSPAQLIGKPTLVHMVRTKLSGLKQATRCHKSGQPRSPNMFLKL